LQVGDDCKKNYSSRLDGAVFVLAFAVVGVVALVVFDCLGAIFLTYERKASIVLEPEYSSSFFPALQNNGVSLTENG
jgi:hypothetical protein